MTGVLAVSGPLPRFLDAGWALTITYLTSPAALAPATVLSVVLAVVAALPVRDGPLPAWWGVPGLVLPRPPGGIVAGIAAGLAAGAVAWSVRGVAADNVNLYRIVEPGPARRPAGRADGLGGIPASIVVTAPNPLPVAGHVLAGGLAVGFLVAPVAALTALVPLPPVRSGVVTALVAAVLAGTAGGAVVAERATLVPGPWSAVPQEPPVIAVTRDEYRNIISPEIVRRHAAVKEAFDALDAEDPPGPVAAARVRGEMPRHQLLGLVVRNEPCPGRWLAGAATPGAPCPCGSSGPTRPSMAPAPSWTPASPPASMPNTLARSDAAVPKSPLPSRRRAGAAWPEPGSLSCPSPGAQLAQQGHRLVALGSATGACRAAEGWRCRTRSDPPSPTTSSTNSTSLVPVSTAHPEQPR